jgi:hypothetical protein
MKLTKLTLCFGTLILGVASAASSYTITLAKAATAGSTELKAGTYKVEVQGNQAVFTQGKTSTTIPVSVEKASSPFRYTSVDTRDSKLLEIDLHGTTTKLVFGSSQPGSVATE